MIERKPLKSKKCKKCGGVFTPHKNLQPYCSPKCAYEVLSQVIKDKQMQTKPRPIKKMSKKREVENKIYLEKRKVFLRNNPQCAVYPELEATECHHKMGRTGSLFLDERYWLAVSRKAHQEIENNPKWAKENGYSLNRL
jgi:hypothetical protein